MHRCQAPSVGAHSQAREAEEKVEAVVQIAPSVPADADV